MTVYAIAHKGAFVGASVTTHQHAEAARQYLAKRNEVAGDVVICAEDLTQSGPSLVVLYNLLVFNLDCAPVKKFATHKDAQRRVFAALEQKYGAQPHEPFNPVPTAPVVEATPSAANQEEGHMAKTKKAKAKKNGARKPRATAPLTVTLPTSLKPAADVKCGTYIRSLVMMRKPTEAILGLVKKHYPDSSAKPSDVSWNRQKLKAAGKNVPAPAE